MLSKDSLTEVLLQVTSGTNILILKKWDLPSYNIPSRK